MLTRVTAATFHQPMGTGKTTPSLVTCVQSDDKEVEMVAKFAAGCEGRTSSLLREALAAMMAADLDLPVPEPFLVNITAYFAAAIIGTDPRCRSAKQHAAASVGWNFGSRKIPPGFSTISNLSEALR